jgi:hypothetical protein
MERMIDELSWFVGGDEDKIRAFQNALNHLCRCRLEADGVFGPETYEAAENFKNGFSKGIPIEHGDWKATGFYAEGKALDFSRGLDLLKFESGIVKFGPKKERFEGEMGVWNADARAGVATDYVGAKAGLRLFSTEGVVKFPTPYGAIIIGGSVDFGGLGFGGGFDVKKRRLEVKGSKVIGGSIIIGFEAN